MNWEIAVGISAPKHDTMRHMRRALGRYIVADSTVCHGRPVFRGTRIFVSDVLDQVASGTAWDVIIEEWQGAIKREAIAEAVRLAGEAFAGQERELGRVG